MILSIDGNRITIKNSLKYLSIVFDRHLNFKDHILHTCKKTSNSITAVSKIMPHLNGPREAKRRILISTCKSILPYAAPVWADALVVTRYCNIIESTYRRAKLRAIQGYQKISKQATDTISGTLLISLELRLAVTNFNCRNQTNLDDKVNTSICSWILGKMKFGVPKPRRLRV